MSNVYSLEPPTKGKVVITTSVGDIDIELWPKEAPKAVRNFVQLCLESYYDKTIFHRIIKDFMVQGGDPTGTGTGGDSIYGEAFADEIHSRIHFNHRGQVAMANSGAKDSNGSQFFITFDRCPWVDKKHTIFGKVTGNSVYNLMKMSDFPTREGTDRPLDPPLILKTEVVWNPFEDIVPRNKMAAHNAVLFDGEVDDPRKKKKKNLALLSFGEEAEEEEAQVDTFQVKPRSIHDAVTDDPRLVAAGTSQEEEQRAKELEELEREKNMKAMKARIAERQKKAGDEEGAGGEGPAEEAEDFATTMARKAREKKKEFGGAVKAGDSDSDGEKRKLSKEEKLARREEKARLAAEREAAKQEREHTKMRRLGIGKAATAMSSEDVALYTVGEVKRREIKAKKLRTADREKETLERLQRFQAQLEKGKTEGGAAASEGEPAPRDGAAGAAKYQAEGLYYLDDDQDDSDWKSHSLKFEKPKGRDMSYAPEADDYVVHDPLLEKGKGKFSKQAQQEKKKSSQWAGRSVT